jgi:hypothetical protein
MKDHLSFASAVATALQSAGLPATISVYAHHQPPAELALPALAVLMESVTFKHQAITQAVLVLRYLSDPDSESSASAATDLADATCWLLSDPVRAALRQPLAERGIWLRVISPSDTAAAEPSDRERRYETRLNVWLQTTLP